MSDMFLAVEIYITPWGALLVQTDVSIKAAAQKSTLKYRSYLVILDLGATPGMLQFAAAVSKYISASLIYLAMPGWSSRILWFMILDIAYRNKSKHQMANVLWCSICTELCGQFVPESAGLCRVLVQSCTTGEFRQEKRAQNRANCANLRVSSKCFWIKRTNRTDCELKWWNHSTNCFLYSCAHMDLACAVGLQS